AVEDEVLPRTGEMARDVVRDRDGVEVPRQDDAGRQAPVGSREDAVAVADHPGPTCGRAREPGDGALQRRVDGPRDLRLVPRRAGDVDEGAGQVDRISGQFE